MSLGFQDLVDRVQSHALASGWFERVNGHEPKSAPGSGLTAAVWLQNIRPTELSGLNSTSGRVELMIRIYHPMLAEPQDAIDPTAVAAADDLMSAYSGDFDLGGTVRNVDLLGQDDGVGLSLEAGYVAVNNVMYRALDITLPVIINDVWEQVA